MKILQKDNPENGAETGYHTTCGMTMRREQGLHPNGFTQFNDRWVLRDAVGAYIDHDQYRNDLIERQGLTFAR